jgi:hypothetical protein
MAIGCSPAKYYLTPSPSKTTTDNSVLTTPTPTETRTEPTVISSGDYLVDISKVKENNWAMFGAIDVSYKLGVQVDGFIKGYQPFYIVNRYNEAVERKAILTEPKEVTADIPINKLLHNGILSSVIGIESNLSSDRLVVIGYVSGTNSLTITGFTPNVSRIATIKYKPDTVYRVTLNNDKNAGNNLAQYFKLERERITVAPNSFEPINYSFMIPEDMNVPDNFSVWIYAEPTYVTSAGVGYNIGYYVPIKVHMN